MEPQAGGRYFEVVVEDTVAGWVGGLGIGVTATPPELAGRSPDKAWRMQKTFVIGYGGCIYLDGVERRTNWHPDTLAVGARVGLLVAEQGDGDIIVFVDGQPVVRMEGARLSAYDALYPVVDVFAATRSVSLCRWSSPPLPPWRIAAELGKRWGVGFVEVDRGVSEERRGVGSGGPKFRWTCYYVGMVLALHTQGVGVVLAARVVYEC